MTRGPPTSDWLPAAGAAEEPKFDAPTKKLVSGPDMPVDGAGQDGSPWPDPVAFLEEIRRQVEWSADRATLSMWGDGAYLAHPQRMGDALQAFVTNLGLVLAEEAHFRYALPREPVAESVQAIFDYRLKVLAATVCWIGGRS
jgi:hypothetical protein